jgi:signal transduction histidine kinase
MPQSAGRGLGAWPIRRKLIALVAVPVLVIVAAGIWLTTSSVNGLRQAERTRSLANAAMATNVATVALDNELAQTLTVLRTPTPATKLAMTQKRAATNAALSTLTSYLADPPSGNWSGDVLSAASAVTLTTQQLPTARSGADAGSRSPLVVETSFQSIFSALRNLTSNLSRDIATTTADGRTVDQASMLAALASASASAADERATGTIALAEKRLSANQLAALTKLAIEQDTDLQIASDHATPEQRSDIEAITFDDSRIQEFRKDLTMVADATITGEKVTPDATAFSAALGQRLENLDALVGRVAQQTRDNASARVRSALLGTIGLAALAVFTLLLVFATLAAIARTVTGPMRRLRSGAVEVATVRLPQAVRQIEQQGVDATIDLPPVMPPGTVAGPETLEVAHAVDGLTAEAVRLATAQVRLRHALDEAFVSMSRRSQTMVEKQLAIIDELESTEEDPEQLRNLFRLDHLAARMRRYNDNLLVLAGSSVRTRSNTPVPVSDVFRAATSEMEQYERVRLQPVNNAAVSGPVAGGLIHLLAELLDNAAMYSPPTSPILLTAAFTPGGGLHLEVTDSGVGIPPAELAELNARLATPGTIDTQIPSRMGLFVVGRLAQRGGFEVRLSARASAAGTVAEVLVPASHIVGAPQGGQDGPQPARIGAPAQRTPGPLSPQSLPATSLPPIGLPSGLPPRGAPPTAMPPGRPPLGVPAAGSITGAGPDLPRRPDLVWPGADQQREPAAGTAAGAGGGLPSRVPGAALSAGPLLGGTTARNGTPAPVSPFEAFGGLARAGSLGDGPPAGAPTVPPAPAGPTATGPAPTLPSSATAAWSPQARAARAAGAPGLPGGGPAGLRQPEDRTETGRDEGTDTPSLPSRTPFSTLPSAPGDAEPGGPATGTGWPTGLPPVSRETGRDAGQLPPRPDRGGADPFATARLFGVEPPDPATAAGLFTSGTKDDSSGGTGFPGSGPANGLNGTSSRPTGDPAGTQGRRPGDTGGITLPVERVAPLTADLPLLDLKRPNPTPAGTGTPPSNGAPPAGWDGSLPTEQEARGASAGRYTPADPDLPMIGNLDYVAAEAASPIFESMSAWFSDQKVGPTPAAAATTAEADSLGGGAVAGAPGRPAPGGAERDRAERDRADRPFPLGDIFGADEFEQADEPPAVTLQPDRAPAGASSDETLERLPVPSAGFSGPADAPRLIDLRDDVPAATASVSSRWASLGDQQWLAANARAASAPQVAGDTSAGLPRREPGANLLPSAASAAPGTAPGPAAHRADADTVRGRLGSYQRGVSSARASSSRHLISSTPAATLFTAARTDNDQGEQPDEQGGEQ